MKKFLILLAIFIAFQKGANAQKVTLKSLSYLLVGNWETNTPNGRITESWKIHGDSLMGESYRYNLAGARTLTETVVIKKIAKVLHYCVTGHEKNNAGTTNFKLLSTGGKKTFIFENKAHDFPQKIVYQFKSFKSLLAWIEGDIEGQMKKIAFHYQKY